MSKKWRHFVIDLEKFWLGAFFPPSRNFSKSELFSMHATMPRSTLKQRFLVEVEEAISSYIILNRSWDYTVLFLEHNHSSSYFLNVKSSLTLMIIGCGFNVLVVLKRTKLGWRDHRVIESLSRKTLSTRLLSALFRQLWIVDKFL